MAETSDSDVQTTTPTAAQRYYQTNLKAMKPVREGMSDPLKGFAGLHAATMHEGPIDPVHKELMAMAIGLAVRCESCIYSHVAAAKKAGATREQVLDAAGVALMMGGGPVYTYLPRVVEALDALEA